MRIESGRVQRVRFNLSCGKRLIRHNEIPPFYFPTTVVFVDDSRDFLDNLSLQLDAGLAFRLYDSPTDALIALNGVSSQSLLMERFFSIPPCGDDLPMSHHVINLNLDNIVREVHNEHRFGQVSVVVVDYDMPEIDGLELCRNLKNPAVKKVLLTGKADEKVAVQAFNQGLIDRFILKQGAEVIPVLNRAIVDLQLAYFETLGRMVMDALALGSYTFLRDSLFAEEFRQICARLDIVEFYLTANREGILMLDADGVPSLLIVQTEEDMLAHYEIAYDQAAPAALLQALKSNKMVPYFWQSGGEYRPDCHDWQSCLFPATEFKGQEWYYHAVVPKPAGFELGTVNPYNTFLTWLDRQSGALLS